MKLLKVYADKFGLEFTYKNINYDLFYDDQSLYYSDKFTGYIADKPQYLVHPYVIPHNFK